MSKKYLDLYTGWVNDFETMSYLSKFIKPMTLEAEEEWYSNLLKLDDNISFTVFDLETQKPIGTVGLFHIDHVHKTCELGIMIGDKNYWSRGYGTETVRLITDYGFTCLGLHNIMLKVYSFNPRAVRSYEKAGFKVVGKWRQSKRIAGKIHDVIIMEALATEFQNSTIVQSLPEDLL